MTYKELLALYKEGRLKEDERIQVEADIEKHEAIGDYLMEQMDDYDFDSLNNINEEEKDETVEADSFAKNVNSYIRKAFIKMGLIVGAVLLAATLFVIFLLPKVVDSFYYNPGKTAAGTEKDAGINQLSLDFAVYSELFMPENYRDKIMVEGEGYGNYSIYIPQIISTTGTFTNVAGVVKKNKMTLYDTNFINHHGIGLIRSQLSEIHTDMTLPGFDRDYAFSEVITLDEHKFYNAYVTLDSVMTYDEFTDWCKEYDICPNWCAICVRNDAGELSDEGRFGFKYPLMTFNTLNVNLTEYPYLTQDYLVDSTFHSEKDYSWPDDFFNTLTADIMKQHVSSMLRYIDDNHIFLEMMENNRPKGYYKGLAEKIEEQGLYIYGFMIIGQKDTILPLKDIEHIAYVETTPVQ